VMASSGRTEIAEFGERPDGTSSGLTGSTEQSPEL
jgi:hypothetical protein